MTDFLLLTTLAGLGVAIVAGPLGTFVVWRRMAYFGDALAHGAFLGISMGVMLAIHPTIAVMVVCSAFAIILVGLQKQRLLASDTLLGILAHFSLAIGLLSISLQPPSSVDLMSLILGDLLTVIPSDLMWIGIIDIIVIAILIIYWRKFLAITIHEELAKVEGLAVTQIRLLLMVLIALVIAIALKIVGVLLITALLIIPAATARPFSKTPLQMAVFAGFISCLSVCVGLLVSYHYDLPLGPTIVVSNGCLFLISQLIPKRFD